MAISAAALNAFSQESYLPRLQKQFFLTVPLFATLQDKGRYKPVFTSFMHRIPVIAEGVDETQAYASTDPIVYDHTIPASFAEYRLRHFRFPIAFTKADELDIGQSPEKILDLYVQKLDRAKTLLRRSLNFRLNNHDGTQDRGLTLWGLPIAVAGGATVYAGINRGVDTWWRAVVHTSPAVPPANRALTLDLMRDFVLALTDGDIGPDLLITTVPLFGAFLRIAEGRITVNVQSERGKKLAALGFTVAEYMGIPIVADRACMAGVMWGLNTDYITLGYSPGANLQLSPLRQADTLSAMRQELYWSGNLIVSAPMYQGRMDMLIP